MRETFDDNRRTEFLIDAFLPHLRTLEGPTQSRCGTDRWLDLLSPLMDPLILRTVCSLLIPRLAPVLRGPISIGGVGYEGLLLLQGLRSLIQETALEIPVSYFGIATATPSREPKRILFGSLRRVSTLLTGVTLTGRTLEIAKGIAGRGGSEVILCLSIVDRRSPESLSSSEKALFGWSELENAARAGSTS